MAPTLILERLPDGKLGVGSKAWDEKQALLEGHALVIYRDGPYIMLTRQARGRHPVGTVVRLKGDHVIQVA